MESLKTIWGEFYSRAVESSVTDYNTFVILALVTLACLLAFTPIWRFTGIVVTIVHETGHGLAALTTLGKIHGIRINLDHSGDTHFSTSRFFIWRMWSTWWGYSFPGLAGLFLVWGFTSGRVGLALTIVCIVAIIITLEIRNLIAFFTIGLTSMTVFSLWWFAPVEISGVVLFTVGWFLILGGIRSIGSLFKHHLDGTAENSDAFALRQVSLLPATFWVLTFMVFTLFCGAQAFYETYSMLKV
jgi:hypothetical protein